MSLYKSGNPALNNKTFDFKTKELDETNTMTLDGTVNKVFILLFITSISFYAGWYLFFATLNADLIDKILKITGGFTVLLGLLIILCQDYARYLAPIYAILQGLGLGAFSALAEYIFPGIISQAISLTLLIFISILIIYKLRLIKVTENFKLIVASALSGLLFLYAITYILHKFNFNIPFLHESSLYAILVSVYAILMASINLVIDFDFIEEGVSKKVPKYMEWYAAFGLLVTILWLYLEVLNMLIKSKSKK
jgi:uncharacterized YccA/Bax inhibitor family protein